MFWLVLVIIGAVLTPSNAFAWGPLTHVYLGTEVYFMSGALPPAVYGLIRKFRDDYLYGNIMADIIFAKKYLPDGKNPHNWDVALGLQDEASTDPERAFALGYMSHLAADTVAHCIYTKGKTGVGHTFLELQADGQIDRHYLTMALSFDAKVQKRGDVLLKRCLESPIFSFKTNKRILKGIVLVSGLNAVSRMPERAMDAKIEDLHEKSLDRILDVLEKGRNSKVLKKDPRGLDHGRKHSIVMPAALPGGQAARRLYLPSRKSQV
ncbi:MAG: zinc dependent phospholipase C family protein [Nitrospiraceae bacterium]|nr:zinc dependent phospholipase C family protein [Nitrospiraceae bacterium]